MTTIACYRLSYAFSFYLRFELSSRTSELSRVPGLHMCMHGWFSRPVVTTLVRRRREPVVLSSEFGGTIVREFDKVELFLHALLYLNTVDLNSV